MPTDYWLADTKFDFLGYTRIRQRKMIRYSIGWWFKSIKVWYSALVVTASAQTDVTERSDRSQTITDNLPAQTHVQHTGRKKETEQLSKRREEERERERECSCVCVFGEKTLK